MIKTLQILLFGEANKPKYDLHKKRSTNEDLLINLNGLIQKYFYVIALAVILLCFFIFVASVFYFCGISATESGAMRNFINGGYV